MSNVLDNVVRISTTVLLLMLNQEEKRRSETPGSRPFPLPNQKYQKPKFLEIIENIPDNTGENPMIDLQIETEKLFHKNQLFPRIKAEFFNSELRKGYDFRSHMLKHGINPDFGFDLLVQMVLHKRTTLPVLVGILRKHYKGEIDGGCQRTTDELLKACEADLVDWNPGTRQFIIRYDITSDVQEELDRYQYPLPMVVEPREIKTNEDTGYYTSRNSVILRQNHHDEDVCLDHLNRMNQVKLRINAKVVMTIKNSWRNLDKPKPDEEREDYLKRVRAFERYDRSVHDVLFHLGIANENEFWLTHKYDKRGRTYCQGYYVNYQGHSWNKAVVEFVNQEVTV